MTLAVKIFSGHDDPPSLLLSWTVKYNLLFLLIITILKAIGRQACRIIIISLFLLLKPRRLNRKPGFGRRQLLFGAI